MQRLLCIVGVILTALCFAGCTRTVQGTTTTPTGQCEIVGFEDLPAAHLDCGKLIQIPGLSADYTARYVVMDGHKVLYAINDQPLNGDAFWATLAKDETVVRPYVHAAVLAVERLPNADVVQLIASDECPVEKVYGNIHIDLGCFASSPLFGWQLTRDGAVKIISQSMVDQLEKTAMQANGRPVYYMLSMVMRKNP